MSSFRTDGYELVPQLVSRELCEFIYKAMLMESNGSYSPDRQCPLSHGRYASPTSEALLVWCHHTVQALTGLTLLPTYSYHRVYFAGDDLFLHTDRPSCEVSVTVHIGHHLIDNPWPIWMGDTAISMDIGDGVMYRGCDIPHRRDVLKCDVAGNHAQVFLHYVDANGPNAEWAFDKREGLGLKAVDK